MTASEFIGRSAELSTFSGLLASSSKRVLLIDAEQGMGSSRLIAEMLSRSAAPATLTAHIDFKRQTSIRNETELTKHLGALLGPEFSNVVTQQPNDHVPLPVPQIAPQLEGGGNQTSAVNIDATTLSNSGNIAGGDIYINPQIHLNEEATKAWLEAQAATYSRRFVDALQQVVEEQPIILFFDHCEDATPTLQNWLHQIILQLFVEQPYGHIFFVLVNFLRFAGWQTDWLERMTLSPFSDADLTDARLDSDSLAFAKARSSKPATLYLLAANFEANDQPLVLPAEEHVNPARLLEQLPESVVRIVRVAALPRRFSFELLRRIDRSKSVDLAIFSQLEQRQLIVEADAHGAFMCHAQLRKGLVADWQREDPDAYKQVHRQAVDFYEQLDRLREDERLALRFHQIGSGDADALQAVNLALNTAVGNFRLGDAEAILSLAAEHRPILPPLWLNWLEFHQIQLDVAHYNHQRAKPALFALLDKDLPNDLEAHTNLLLAHLLLAQHQWAKAQERYERARALFEKQGNVQPIARVHEAQGRAFLYLAAEFRGMSGINSAENNWLRLRHAPFLLYRWCSRRTSRLPPIYFGSDYQQWIIVWVLQEAIRHFEDARQILVKLESKEAQATVAQLDVLLVDLNHRVERWVAVDQTLAVTEPLLTQMDAPNLYTKFLLTRARIHDARGDIKLAKDDLHQAEGLFAEHHNVRLRLDLYQQQAKLALAEKDVESAATLLLQAVEQCQQMNDVVMATHIIMQLREMASTQQLSSATRDTVEELVNTTAPQAYIARFAGSARNRFQRLAVYVALPLLYAFVLFLLATVQQQVTFLERMTQLPVVQLDRLYALLLLLAPIGLVWLYEGVYILAGWVYVRWRLPLAQMPNQPTYLLTTPTDLSLFDEHAHIQTIKWENTQYWVSLVRSVWRQPLALFSNYLLASEKATISVSGSFTHFAHIRDDIVRRLRHNGITKRFDTYQLTLFKTPWTWVTLAAIILLSALSILNPFDGYPSDPNIPLCFGHAGTVCYRDLESKESFEFTTILLELLIWSRVLLPLQLSGLLLVYYGRTRKWRAANDKRAYVWITLFVFCFFLFWASGEVFIVLCDHSPSTLGWCPSLD